MSPKRVAKPLDLYVCISDFKGRSGESSAKQAAIPDMRTVSAGAADMLRLVGDYDARVRDIDGLRELLAKKIRAVFVRKAATRSKTFCSCRELAKDASR